jgi:hypothetical protein
MACAPAGPRRSHGDSRLSRSASTSRAATSRSLSKSRSTAAPPTPSGRDGLQPWQAQPEIPGLRKDGVSRTATGEAVRLVALEESRSERRVRAGRATIPRKPSPIRRCPARAASPVSGARVLSPMDQPGSPLTRVACSLCNEGINDGLVVRNGTVLCRSCAERVQPCPGG